MSQQSEEPSAPEDKSSGKNLVPILVIVAIGIPVLIELMTLFNLINVHLVTEPDESSESVKEFANVREISEGDTLSLNSSSSVIVDKMIVKVGTQEWDFEMRLVYPDSAAGKAPKLQIDSLSLQQNNIIRQPTDLKWSRNNGDYFHTEAEWRLPSGKVPEVLYISVHPLPEDSGKAVQQEVKLGKIPVRYERQ